MNLFSNVTPQPSAVYPTFFSTAPLRRLIAERQRPGEPITQTVVMMTPQLAADLLTKNHPRNREVRARRVRDLRSEMERGRWTLSASIKLGPDLMVGDGQHRLSAVVDGGVQVPMMVEVYHDADQFSEALVNIDAAGSRTLGDALVMSGACEKGDGRMFQPIITQICAISANYPERPARADAATIFNAFRSSIEWASHLPRRYKAHVRAALAIAHRLHPEEMDRFATLVTDMQGLHDDSAALLFVKRFEDLNNRARKPGRLEAMKQILTIAHKHVLQRRGGTVLRINDAALVHFFGNMENVR